MILEPSLSLSEPPRGTSPGEPSDIYGNRILESMEVFDSNGQTLVGQDHTWPTGHQFLSSMEPGASAAFQATAIVTGDPDRVRWRLRVKDYQYKITGKYK
jgi:hypothetical protein